MPGSCLLCCASSGGQALCTACRACLPVLPAMRCPRCSLPTSYGEQCGQCLHSPPAFDSVDACFIYEFPADRLIQRLKYGHQTVLASVLADALVMQTARRTLDCIVPLPLHPGRLAERGFNQAAEIARRLSRRLQKPLDLTGLVRERQGEVQASLPLKARHANVRNAFAARRDYAGQRILLVDDVMTTGATLDECSRILRLHGAAAIHCAVIARALPH